ncbi:partial Protein GrpE, partial [Myxococcaceae bacterium]
PPADSADELETVRGELAEIRDRWIRLNADFENFRRRTLREREDAFAYGHEKLAKDLLPAVDNLGRAIDAARKSGVGDLESLLQGLELVQRDLESVLSKHGVTEVEALGQPFDPSVHEALAQLPDASVPANTVVQVFQRGFRLRDRLLRPAQVVVSKAGGTDRA